MSFAALTTANSVPQMMSTVNAVAALAGLWDATPQTVASATTTDIGAPGFARINITGTTTITSLGSSINRIVNVTFLGALTLTHNGTSLILPTGANIATAAGDSAWFASDASGNWRCLCYIRANGKPLVPGDNFGPWTTIASATTTDLSTSATICVNVSGTTTITSLGTGANIFRAVKFAAALTLTHNGTSLILPGAANITTAAGDVAILVSDGSGNWTCLSYTKASGKATVAPAFSELSSQAAGLAAAPFGPFTTIASSGTTDLATVATVGANVTGTTTITSFGTGANLLRVVKFAAALTLTHNGTSLILPGAANITTAAGDTAILLSDGSGNWTCVVYVKASGKSVIAPAFSELTAQAAGLAAAPIGTVSTIASSGTTDLATSTSPVVSVTGTTTITSFGTGANLFRVVKFAAALTLTHNGTSLILPGAANITTAAGDKAILVSDGSGNWTCLSYFNANLGGWLALATSAVARLAVINTFTKPQKGATTAVTSGVAWDASAVVQATVAPNGGTFSVVNPTNIQADVYYSMYINYTTSHGCSFGNAYKGISALALTATAGAHDHLIWRGNSAGTALELVGVAYNTGA